MSRSLLFVGCFLWMCVRSFGVTLLWNDNSTNETGFQIERALNGDGAFSQVGTVAANVTSFVDTTTVPSTLYFYRVAAFNTSGRSGYSNVASITTSSTPAGDSSRLVNMSTRASAAGGDETLIVGFVVSGTATKEFLIRAVGPALSNFGVTAALPNPLLTVRDSAGRVLVSNDNWSSASTPANLFSSVGAFPFPANSMDAAVKISLPAGAYTVQISDSNNRSGIALGEIYETNTASGRMVNLSTRAFVGEGAAVAIAGFVVQGANPSRFLIRAVGPGLTPLGVGGVLADPSLTIRNAVGAVVGANDDWATNSASVLPASLQVAAFSLPSGSRDSALVLTLPFGNYSAQVSGSGGSTGVALVEVYSIPD